MTNFNEGFTPKENNDSETNENGTHINRERIYKDTISEVKIEKGRQVTYINESKDMSPYAIYKKAKDLAIEIKKLSNAWIDTPYSLIIKSKDWSKWSVLTTNKGIEWFSIHFKLRQYDEKNKTNKKTSITIKDTKLGDILQIDWKTIPSKMAHQVFEKLESEIDEFKEYLEKEKKEKVNEEVKIKLKKAKEAQKEIRELMEF